MAAVSEALVGIADRDWSRRGGRSARVAELAVHLVEVRRVSARDLVRLETFVAGDRAIAHVPERHRGCWRRWARPAVCTGRGRWRCPAMTSSSVRARPGTTTLTIFRGSSAGVVRGARRLASGGRVDLE